MKFTTTAMLLGVSNSMNLHRHKGGLDDNAKDNALSQLITSALAGAPPGEINEPVHADTDTENMTQTTQGHTRNYSFHWQYACAFTKWVPSNQFLNSNGHAYDAATMTLERFGFIGMNKKCFWGMVGVDWVTPLKVEQVRPPAPAPPPPAPAPEPVRAAAPAEVLAHTNGNYRLVVDNLESMTGRFEHFANGQWGTWCDDIADRNNNGAQVACKTLNLPWTEATHHDVTGPESAPILMDGVECTGTENSISECPQNAVGDHNCVHSEDMGITCAGEALNAYTHGNYRLVHDGQGVIDIDAGHVSGRFEYLHNGAWGTWCDDVADSNNMGAQVACKSLGLAWTEASHHDVTGPDDAPIHFDNVACTGAETDIMECPMNAVTEHNCVHSEDMGITCAGTR